jgi:hypothetical protein
MSWTMREAAEVILAGRKAARRHGSQFHIDKARMTLAGFTPEEVGDIERAVEAIEMFKETELSKLQRRL